jgi:hypothetical protein
MIFDARLGDLMDWVHHLVFYLTAPIIDPATLLCHLHAPLTRPRYYILHDMEWQANV